MNESPKSLTVYKKPFIVKVDREKIGSRVKALALELYRRRGGGPGNDWDDWFNAEKIIKNNIYIDLF
jgi:hypothetical protein